MAKQRNTSLSDRSTKLLAIFGLGFLLFNFPLLQLFGVEKMVGGIPGIFVYLFLAWLGIIILIFWTMHRKDPSRKRP